MIRDIEIMKKLSIGLVLAGLILSSNISMADADYGCTQKVTALEEQLAYAKAQNNTYRIKGLERAIANVKQYCGGGYSLDSAEAKSYYEADQRLDVLDKIADAKKDLSKAEYKLGKAKRKGDIEDQYESEYKIQEAQRRIDMYEKYLEEMK